MSSKTGYVYDARYLLHNPGPMHPERPQRLEAIHRRIQENGLLEQLVLLEPYEAPLEWITKLHDPDYIQRFKEACDKGYGIFMTPDCGICKESYAVARLAVGGVFAAVDAVMEGKVKNVFCAVRPPGHHAERRRAMGFCFFANVALGAVYLLEHYGLERVAIVDWDVHHGNGTQHLLEEDPRVFFLSLHQDPTSCYPGTGYATERGRGAGIGYTLNLPLPPGSGDTAYLHALERDALPRLRQFQPQFILISAGFDAHQDDPLAHQELTRAGYQAMGRHIFNLAQEYADGKLITVLEGGYNLQVLADCVEDHLRLLMEAS